MRSESGDRGSRAGGWQPAAGVLVGVVLLLAGCGLPGTGVSGPIAAPSVAAADKLDGGVIDAARSLAAQADAHVSDVQSLAARLAGPVSSLAAALGGPSAAAAAPAGTVLCAAFTPAQITAATGVPVGAGVVGGPSRSQCQWSSPSGAKGVTRIALRVGAGAVARPRGGVAVSGVTASSYLVAVKGGWQAVAAHGSGSVAVTVTGPRATKAAPAAVLRLVLARL